VSSSGAVSPSRGTPRGGDRCLDSLYLQRKVPEKVRLYQNKKEKKGRVSVSSCTDVFAKQILERRGGAMHDQEPAFLRGRKRLNLFERPG